MENINYTQRFEKIDGEFPYNNCLICGTTKNLYIHMKTIYGYDRKSDRKLQMYCKNCLNELKKEIEKIQ